MKPDNRNLIMAIALSMVVLFGWQMFVIKPQLEQEAAQQELLAEQAKAEAALQASQQADSGTPSVAQTSNANMGVNNGAVTGGISEAKPQDTAPRILIDAPLITGSISVMGARIDDVVLTDYKVSQDPGSENIKFLHKSSSSQPYFVEFGWSSSDANQPMPRADTLWQANKDVLSPGAPVTLRWDNGQGLTFIRQISINDDYLITYDDSVQSTLGNAITLYPYGLVRRHGTPPSSGIYILHEG
ncbi:MAG: membrane protein insertase YidC, partial [Candidatus Puniceispirillum sp.]|nr:membrane protein insertase YidC [Candidatus Puniceispirillum sp.]